MIIEQDYTLVVDLINTGITEIVLEGKKPTSTTFSEIILGVDDFAEAEHGFYNIKVPGSFITEYGKYIFRITGYELELFETQECNPTPLHSVIPPEVCIVMGNIRNASANVEAFAQVRIEARPLKLPHLVSGTFTLGQIVHTYTDYSGYFQLPLIRGMTALIEIKDVGVRFQAVIPDADTVRIEDLVP